MNELASADCFMDSAEAADFAAATKSSVVVVGSWGATAARDALGDNFAATVLPKFTVNGKKYQIGSFSGSKLMGVKPQTDVKKAKAAHALANYLSGEEMQKELFTKFGWGGTNKVLQATDAYKNDVVLSSLVKQADYAIPQGQILGAWWTIGNAIKKNLADLTDKSDASLKGVLQTYYNDLKAAFDVQGDALWVGTNQDWKCADPNSLLEEKDGVYTITVTYTDAMAYKGGRVVKPASWDTLGGWEQVAEESKALLDEAYNPEKKNDKDESVNPDHNIVFKEAGTYVITFDLVTKKVTITKQ
jgi:arabinogalactan oligomer/maltooligosaccharide transport system substrate-binding protein